MAPKAKVLAFAGSTRTDSFNKKLIRIAAEGAQAQGAEVTTIDLRDFPLPLYDGDLEASQGLPENATKLKEIFLAHDALLIASPEYNSSVSAVLKNTIDWVSRPRKGEPDLASFAGKVAGILSASPGALGGLRGLVTLRSLLGNIKVTVLPDQVSIPNAGQAFGPDGALTDQKKTEQVKGLGAKVAQTASLLKNA